MRQAGYHLVQVWLSDDEWRAVRERRYALRTYRVGAQIALIARRLLCRWAGIPCLTRGGEELPTLTDQQLRAEPPRHEEELE